MSERLLSIEKLSAGYGGRPVLEDFDLALDEGQRVALIGPNGCGKSTLLRTIMAEVPETSGRIRFAGEDITDLETDAVVGRGIGYLRQTRNVFPSLTVDENLELAGVHRSHNALRDRDRLLRAFPVLGPIGARRAGALSGGERQALAVVMVLRRRVRLLLLDEPLAGLSPRTAAGLLEGVADLQREEGFALVIIEHRLKLIQSLVNRVIIMVRGVISEDTGDPAILTQRDRLEQHYLA